MVLAHGGGLPETATVVIPVIVVLLFIRQERRNMRRLRERQAAESGVAESGVQEPGDA